MASEAQAETEKMRAEVRRLEALRLAVETCKGRTAEVTIDTARSFEAYINGADSEVTE